MDIKLPKLGEGAESGSVVSVLVKVGDKVRQGQTLLELENEKAIASIPSPAAGKITKIHVAEGQKVAIGQLIMSLAESSEVKPEPGAQAAATIAAAEPESAEPEPAEVDAAAGSIGPELDQLPPTPEAKPAQPPPTSPSIRKMARELGIDLTRIRGSARGGRIEIQDVKAYIQRLQQIAFAPKPAPGKPIQPTVAPVDFSQWGAITKKQMSPLRQIISRRMHESWTAIPHVTQFDEADITELLVLRKTHGAANESKGVYLTLTPFVIKAVVDALKQHSIFNASLDEADNQIIYKEYYNIGIAVDTEAGLIVPVVRNADQKGILELAKELQVLADKTRSRRIGAEDLKGGTFTISNQGGIGGAHFTPIINKPEVAILGLGRGASKPAVRNNNIEARTMLPLCVSYDHRLIDGADAARFIRHIAQTLESAEFWNNQAVE